MGIGQLLSIILGRKSLFTAILCGVVALVATVSLLAPTNGAVFGQPVDLTLTAAANDSDGVVTKVEFFAGAMKVGEDTSAPFAFTWTNAPFGVHEFTARATDDRLAAAVSAPVTITVLARRPTQAAKPLRRRCCRA